MCIFITADTEPFALLIDRKSIFNWWGFEKKVYLCNLKLSTTDGRTSITHDRQLV